MVSKGRHRQGGATAPARTVVAAVAAAVALASPGPADASFVGTPGKVAWITSEPSLELQIWDPVTGVSTPVTDTVHPQTDSSQWGTNGRPVWSPDGTKVAFTKTVDDPGSYEIDGHRIDKHTAIFVYDLVTGGFKQVTEPPAGQKIESTENSLVGHVVADFAPAWDARGTTIGFTRHISSAGEDDSLWADRGQNLWTVPASGGGATRVTSYPLPTDGQVQATVGVPEQGGFITYVTSYDTSTGEKITALKREGGSGRGGVLASRTGFATIADFDVSPDGTKLAYTVGSILPGPAAEAVLVPLDAIAPDQALPPWPGTFLRFSNTGSGVLRFGCSDHGPRQCGMAEHRLDDPRADIRPGEPDRVVNVFPGIGPSGVGGTQTSVDVQPQILPVIYIPGFLGSEIACGPSRIWPIGTDLPRIALDASGTGTPQCPSAGPTGKLVGTVLTKDVYQSAMTFMTNRFGDRGTLFGWDWRKPPKATLLSLNDAVKAAIDKANQTYQQGIGRVTIVAHSYGGLLTRAYLEVAAAKVARVLTLGTPYWGSPKAVFPLALGRETPVSELGLDTFIDDDEMQLFARNLAGNYQLFPSPPFGSWLSLNGLAQGQPGVAAFVRDQNGNAAMLAAAQAEHARIYDGFFDNSSLIDYRAVSGTGVASFGKIDLRTNDDDLIDVNVTWVNGDKTVPAKSAGQGPIGVFPPKGDPVHVQHTCRLEHVALGGAPAVLAAYADFLDYGRVPRKLQGPCLFAGMEAKFTGLTRPRISVHRPARAGAAAVTMTPFAAARAGLADVLVVGKRVLVKTDLTDAVTLSVRAKGTVAIAPIGEKGKGKTLTYRLTGKTVKIAPPATEGVAPVVRQGTKKLKPVPAKKKSKKKRARR